MTLTSHALLWTTGLCSSSFSPSSFSSSSFSAYTSDVVVFVGAGTCPNWCGSSESDWGADGGWTLNVDLELVWLVEHILPFKVPEMMWEE